ncbi:MAG: hypothetical protein ABEJ92_00955 [Halobacteriales archaeon]
MTGERIEVERVETVPGGASVRHFDELAEPAKVVLPALVPGDGGTAACADAEVVDTLGDVDGDIVKFTDYYRVRRRSTADR